MGLLAELVAVLKGVVNWWVCRIPISPLGAALLALPDFNDSEAELVADRFDPPSESAFVAAEFEDTDGKFRDCSDDGLLCGRLQIDGCTEEDGFGQ